MGATHWITADRIHNGEKWFPSSTYLKVNADGLIEDIQFEKPTDTVTHYDGWICPGFVNVHCHLELSFMKGVIPKHTGLIPFLQLVVGKRGDFSLCEKSQLIQQIIQNAASKGIVAFGDICNTTDSIPAKKQSNLYFHSFIESMGKVPVRAEAAFDFAQSTFDIFQLELSSYPYSNSIVPHAPYSVSEPLFEKINTFDNNAILSIHSQETEAETDLFLNGDGPMISFYESMRIPLECAEPKGMNSLQWILQQTDDSHPLILVHNTFIQASDIDAVLQRKGKTYFCLCPNANLYIENTLPPIDLLFQYQAPVCIGTDSLASNDDICVFSEIKIIHQHFSAIDWEYLLQWATLNGAKALGIDSIFGKIEVGKNPGLVHIDVSLQNANRIA